MFQWHTLMTYHKMLLHYIPVWHMLYIYDIHSWHNDSMTYSMTYTKRLCVNDIFNDICSSWHTCMTYNNDIPPNIHDIWNPGIVMVPKHSWHTLMTYAYVIRYVIVIFRYVMAAYVIKSTRICHSTREFTDVVGLQPALTKILQKLYLSCLKTRWQKLFVLAGGMPQARI